MSSAEAWVTAYTRGLEMSILSLLIFLPVTLSMPVIFTGDRIVFIMSHDQKRARLCCMRPLRSKSEQSREIVPKTMVKNQINGVRMKYERRRLSQPWLLLGRTAGCSSDHAGTAGRRPASSFSGSAVVAILFTVSKSKNTFAGGGARATHS